MVILYLVKAAFSSIGGGDEHEHGECYGEIYVKRSRE